MGTPDVHYGSTGRRHGAAAPVIDALREIDQRRDVERLMAFVRRYGIYLASHSEVQVDEEARRILSKNASGDGELRQHAGGIWLRLCDARPQVDLLKVERLDPRV